ASDPDPGDTVTLTCTPASGATFPLGPTTVNCHAVDNHGAASDKSFTITVVDTTPPTIDPHPDLSVTTIEPAGTHVSYTPPNASAPAEGCCPVTCAPTSGSHFDIGNTSVHCSATDTHNNHATETTFLAHALLSANNPPVISVPADITAE